MKHVVIRFFIFLIFGLVSACDYYSSDEDSDTDNDAPEAGCDPAWGSFDKSSGICWQHPAADHYLEWEEALDYCDELSLGGHTDWSLPSRNDFVAMLGGCDDDVLNYSADSCVDEYESSSGFGYCNSCSDSINCTGLFGSDTNWYWTSSDYCDCSYFFVDLLDGYMY